jgi:crotonobetainyl-CoA:carnitine CoA-transferase CaiB-like acyl-CoA transferase
MEALQKAGIAAAPSLNPKTLSNDPQIKARGFFKDIDHPVLGKITLAGLPWKPEDGQEANYSCPPLLGEHNDYVFGELLGLADDEIAGLKEAKVIY